MPRLTFPSRIPSSSSPAAAAFSFASTSRLPLPARASSSHCCTQKQILHHQPQSPPPPSAQCTTGVSSRNLSGSVEGEATTSSLVRRRDAHPSSTFSLTALRTALPSLSSSRSSASSFSGTALLSSVRPSISLPLRATPQPSSVRFVTYGSEYQPSQLKRKRKHGFLARLKKKNGRKILIRRRLAGRRFLSH